MNKLVYRIRVYIKVTLSKLLEVFKRLAVACVNCRFGDLLESVVFKGFVHSWPLINFKQKINIKHE